MKRTQHQLSTARVIVSQPWSHPTHTIDKSKTQNSLIQYRIFGGNWLNAAALNYCSECFSLFGSRFNKLDISCTYTRSSWVSLGHSWSTPWKFQYLNIQWPRSRLSVKEGSMGQHLGFASHVVHHFSLDRTNWTPLIHSQGLRQSAWVTPVPHHEHFNPLALSTECKIFGERRFNAPASRLCCA